MGGGNFHSDLAELEAEHHEITKVKNISKICMGKYEVEAWYYSPFPAPYAQAETLYICEYCLKYMKNPRFFLKHCSQCGRRTPPGEEIYREGKLSVFELDGKDHRVYCQNLCLLAKLFLDHKSEHLVDVQMFILYRLLMIPFHSIPFQCSFVLRRRSVLFLRNHRSGRGGSSYRGIFL